MSIMSDLQAIADAIRCKTGKTDSMTLSEMAGEIAQISGGGSEMTLYEGVQAVLRFETTKEQITINEDGLYIGTAVTEVE